MADPSASKTMSRNFALKNKALSIVKKASGDITKDTLVKNEKVVLDSRLLKILNLEKLDKNLYKEIN